jgi:hypothetical protein
MTINSRAKGKRGELEFAELCRESGFTNARRGQQFKGGDDSPDVVDCFDHIHCEVKRVEKLNIDEAIEQAEKDRHPCKMAAVFHRRDRKKWKVTMYFDDWVEVYKVYEGYMRETYCR